MSKPAAAQQERETLKAAILWALGLNGEFPTEPEPLAGKYRRRYYWRGELAKRAGIDVNAEAALSTPSTPEPSPQEPTT